MDEAAKLLERALAGNADAVRALVDRLTPIIQARVARALSRAGRSAGRDARQELEDLVQEVFATLFKADGKALKAWREERGLSFDNFVGFLAEREVASILRSGRRSPWSEDPTLMDDLDGAMPPTEGPGPSVESKDLLSALLSNLRAELSPKGLRLFELLIVKEASIEDAVKETGMEAGALYTWKSRLRRHVQQIAERLQQQDASGVTSVRG